MVLNVTTWSPDTCDCVIEYEWDDAQDEKTRVHIAKAILKDCGLHKKPKDKDGHFATVLEENQRKNLTFGTLQEDVSDLSPDEYVWSFDDKRILHVKSSKLDTAEKKQKSQDKCDAKIGKGKVIVE
jgi:hypothetical protein